MSMYRYIKRFFDIILSIILIILLSPVILVTYIILKIDLGGKILFKQDRLGLNKKQFVIYKFKSMNDNISLSHDERIDKICYWIRRSGLDELPQLINILKGDMSFVGPRPFMVYDQLPESAYIEKRYYVKPGIFGLAQIHGRRDITHENKIKYDLEYVDTVSFKTDIILFFQTIFVVIGQLFKKNN